MSTTLSIDQQKSFGQRLKGIRIFLQLSRRELAQRFGVTTKDISLFERDLPLRLDTKLKILKQVYPIKIKK